MSKSAYLDEIEGEWSPFNYLAFKVWNEFSSAFDASFYDFYISAVFTIDHNGQELHWFATGAFHTRAGSPTVCGQLGARLHQASASMLRLLCNDTSDTVLIENNGVTP